MSTRCQVQVIQEGLGSERITLYHHTDGYPEHILDCIASAYAPDWQHGRAGKVASFLCAAHPGVFEPEEYFYELFVVDGSLAEWPRWEVAIYQPTPEFWEVPAVRNLTRIRQRRVLAPKED